MKQPRPQSISICFSFPNRLTTTCLALASWLGVMITCEGQTLWHNDFSSSPNLADYVGSGPNQADAISSGGSGLVWSIEDEALKVTRSGSNAGAFTINGDNWNSPSLLVEIRLQVVDITANGTASLYFGVGHNFTTSNNRPDNNNTHSDFSINFIDGDPDTFQFRDHDNLTNLGVPIAAGQWVTIWWGINNSGSDIPYLRPDGTTTLLASDRWDLWVQVNDQWHHIGNNLNSTLNNPGEVALDDFKIYFGPNAQGTVLFDSITISGSLAGMTVPEPSVAALLLAISCLRPRRRPNA